MTSGYSDASAIDKGNSIRGTYVVQSSLYVEVFLRLVIVDSDLSIELQITTRQTLLELPSLTLSTFVVQFPLRFYDVMRYDL